jgi:hypothetical protein
MAVQKRKETVRVAAVIQSGYPSATNPPRLRPMSVPYRHHGQRGDNGR